MGTVTLTGTFHEERGRVSSLELNEILMRVNPEVIFIEESPYVWQGLAELAKTKPLESAAISKYIEAASPKLVPVDLFTEPAPYVSHMREVLSYVERVSDTFCKLVDFNKTQMEARGFVYLNSNLHEQVELAIRTEVLRILGLRKSESLDRAHNAWRGHDEKREAEMVGNIQRYFLENGFERSIFLVGSAHRASIAKRTIEQYRAVSNSLRWDCSDHWYV